jgi:hypothetical protein
MAKNTGRGSRASQDPNNRGHSYPGWEPVPRSKYKPPRGRYPGGLDEPSEPSDDESILRPMAVAAMIILLFAAAIIAAQVMGSL